MTKVIWKFAVGRGLNMPLGAKIVHVAKQKKDGQLCLWAIVDQTKDAEFRRFEIVGTGHPIPYGGVHVGTWFDADLVWHLFEIDLGAG